MNLREALEKIGKEYLYEKNKIFKKNKLANFIRNDIKLEIEKLINDSNYNVSCSPGKGQWAIIPWIAIFDTDITNTATRGHYIVYLFSADMKKLYLSLNRGWTELKKEKNIEEILKIKNKVLFEKLKNEKFNLKNIDLRSSAKLPKGYEIAHIIGKEYNLESLPSNEKLVEDLKSIIELYRNLKKIIINEVYINYNNILNEDNEKYQITDKKLKINNNKVIMKNIIKENNIKSDKENKKNNIDFVKKQENNTELGKAGEDLVYKKEKEILKNANREDLSEKVFLTREKDNTAPYDILSYNKNGEEKYIEVKTTMGNFEEEFYISESEVEFSEEHSENYYLYRIYNFNSKEPNCEIYKGKINREYLESIKYKAKLLK